MPDYTVISKGKYNRSQSGNSIPAVSYIFVREQGKKKLLIKFTNTRKSVLTGLNLDITALDMYGREISVKNHKFGDLSVKPKRDFVLTHKIEVEEECTDFSVSVKEALYGSYAYSENASGEKIDYLAPKEKFDVAGAVDEMRWESVTVKERIVKKRAVIGIFSFLLVIALCVFTFFQLKDFTGKQKTFLYNGVEYAFEGDDESYGTDIHVVGYGGSRYADITVPEKIEGHAVKSIKKNAFKDNGRIKKLTVESDIVIEEGAFSGCKKLAEISIPKVKSLGMEAFADCEKLAFLNAENLESIGGYAFKNCTSLESVELKNDKKSLTLGEFAFYNCSALQTADIEQTIIYPADYSVFRDCNNLTELKLKNFQSENGGREQTVISLFGTGEEYGKSIKLEKLTIDTLDYIGKSFCAYAPLKRLTVGEIESAEIGEGAFNGCSSLAVLDLPVSVEKANDYAFYGTALEEFDDGALTYAGKYSFAKSAVTGLTGGKIAHIDEYAFSDCTSLEVFTFGDKICEFIGVGAFSGCTSLANVKYPQTQTAVPDLLFYGCSSLSEITFADSRVETIGESAFADCKRLPEINIPQTVSVIGNNAFSGCAALSIVSFPEGGKLETIGDGAFADCAALYTVKVPDTVTSVGLAAFSGCDKLSVLTVPYVGGKAGENSYLGYIFGSQRYNNTAAYVPDSLETVNVTIAKALEMNAFYGCDHVVNINLPDTLLSVAPGAFAVCSALKSITIPDSVTEIGMGAFRECSSLEEITLPFVGGSVNENTFLGYIFGAVAYAYADSFVPASLGTVNVRGQSRLGDYAFAYCTNLKKINLALSEDLLSIGSYAFYDCIRLGEVNLPEKLVTIGERAFFNCIELRKMVIPASVTAVGGDIFGNCFKLYEIWNLSRVTGITAPNLLRLYTTLEDEMQKYFVDGYEIGFTDDNYYLLSYPKGEAELSLPTGYDYILTSHLFYWDSVIEKVTVPSCVTEIGNFAFRGCAALREVVLGNRPNFTQIGGYAFAECSALEQINIPYGVEIIYDFAFSECRSLAEITLPATVRIAGASAFASCSSLQSIVLTYGLQKIGESAFAGCGSVKNIEIPESVDFIDGYAFYNCSSLESVVIPSSVATLNSYAFAECTSLRYLEIAYGLREIGVNAFSKCTSLVNVKISESVTTIGDYAFSECRALTGLELYEGLEYIGSYAFSNCSSLTYLNLPANLKQLNASAFAFCERLESLTIGEGLDEIGDGAFSDCAALSEITLPNSLRTIGGSAFRGARALKGLIIPEGVRTVGGYAFENCVNLRSVSLPSSLDRVEWGAFENCVKLYLVYNFSGLNLASGSSDYGSVAFRALAIVRDYADAEYADARGITYLRNIDSWLAVWGEEGLTSVTLEAFNYGGGTVNSFDVLENIFEGNAEIASVTIGSAVENLGANAFGGCYSLKTVKFDNAVSCIIGDGAFQSCTALTSVEFTGGSPTATGRYAFAGCGQLGALRLADGLKEVSENSFYNSGLSSVAIPSSVTVIGNYAFAYCYGLNTVNLADGLKEIGGYAFVNSAVSSLAVPSSVTKISDCAFDGCYNLSDLSLAEGLAEIGSYAFRGCNALRALSIPSSVTSLGNGAFSDCSALQELELGSGITEIRGSSFSGAAIRSLSVPSSVTKIGEYAFENCANLINLELSENLREIGTGAFSGCTSLGTLIVPSSVTYISGGAFRDCTSLYVVYNLSRLNITERGTDNGYAGYYAVAIFDNLEERAYFADTETCKFVLLDGEWYLFKYSGDSVVYLPQSFNYGGERVSSYTVRNYAFENTYVYELIVPEAVKQIQPNAFASYVYGNVYFEGTEDEWQELKTSSLNYATLYVKVGCVHEYYQWTYTSDGRVTTEIDAYPYRETERVDATCTEDGYYIEQCTNCDHTRRLILYATGHSEVIDPAKEPTCTEAGLTEGRHCEVCGEVIQAQQTIPATGHTEVTDPAKAPTCTETGLTEGKHCGVCGVVIEAQQTIPATGHTEVTDPAEAPTCTEEGLTEGKHCETCETVTVAQQTVPAKGHSYAVTERKEPTCTETGHVVSVCEECGDRVEETLEMTEHNYGDDGVCTVCGRRKDEE